MKVDNQLVDKVAELAKLEFDAQAKQKDDFRTWIKYYLLSEKLRGIRYGRC